MESLGFNRWIMENNVIVNHEDVPLTKHPQMRWAIDSRGDLIVDHIAHFENLTGLVSKLRNVVGVELELPHLNGSNKDRYQDHYTAVGRKFVEKHFGADIEYGKYRF